MSARRHPYASDIYQATPAQGKMVLQRAGGLSATPSSCAGFHTAALPETSFKFTCKDQGEVSNQ